MDAYYESRRGDAESVATAVALRLASPNPRDTRVLAQLASYKGLVGRYAQWGDVVTVCRAVALAMVVQP